MLKDEIEKKSQLKRKTKKQLESIQLTHQTQDLSCLIYNQPSLKYENEKTIIKKDTIKNSSSQLALTNQTRDQRHETKKYHRKQI